MGEIRHVWVSLAKRKSRSCFIGCLYLQQTRKRGLKVSHSHMKPAEAVDALYHELLEYNTEKWADEWFWFFFGIVVVLFFNNWCFAKSFYCSIPSRTNFLIVLYLAIFKDHAMFKEKISVVEHRLKSTERKNNCFTSTSDTYTVWLETVSAICLFE